MTIISFDQIIRVIDQSRSWANELFGIILHAIVQNISTYGIAMWNDLQVGNWLTSNTLILFGSVLSGFYLVRKKPLMALKTFFAR